MQTLTILAAALMVGSALAQAQEGAAAKTTSSYRLKFSVHESAGGKRLKTNQYTLLLQEGVSGQLNISTRVAVPTGSMTQYYQPSLGLRCRVENRQGEPALFSEITLSGLEVNAAEPDQAPIVRDLRSTLESSGITLGKPVTILSADEPGGQHWGQHHIDVEVVVTLGQ